MKKKEDKQKELESLRQDLGSAKNLYVTRRIVAMSYCEPRS